MMKRKIEKTSSLLKVTTSSNLIQLTLKTLQMKMMKKMAKVTARISFLYMFVKIVRILPLFTAINVATNIVLFVQH